MVDAVLARFDAARAQNPTFEGTSGIVAAPQEGTVFVYSPEDARGRVMSALGFVDVPAVTELAGEG